MPIQETRSISHSSLNGVSVRIMMFEHAGNVFCNRYLIENFICKVIFITMFTRRFEQDINPPS